MLRSMVHSFKVTSTMPVKSFKLLDGTQVPWVAFGTGTALYQKDCADACKLALSSGFTHLDAAQVYGNEEGVGSAIASYSKPRDTLYITTKLSAVPEGKGVEDTLRESLTKLKVDYVDLFLIHMPAQHKDREGGIKAVWKEMIDVKKKGLTRSIGVSNFTKKQLEEIIGLGLEKPAVNQVCLFPFLSLFLSNSSSIQIEYHLLVATRLEPLLAYSQSQGIVTASYGGLTPILPSRTGSESLAPVRDAIASKLSALASARGTSVTQNQILLKWLEAKGVIAVTTSSKESRLKEYLEAERLPPLSEEELTEIEKAVGGAHFRAFVCRIFPRILFITRIYSFFCRIFLNTWMTNSLNCRGI